MKRFFLFLASLVALWLLGSFVGVMVDTARANMWTQSLMWALLTCVLLAPVLIFVGTAPSSGSNQSATNSQSGQAFDVNDKAEVSQPQESVEAESEESAGAEDAAEREGWPYKEEE